MDQPTGPPPPYSSNYNYSTANDYGTGFDTNSSAFAPPPPEPYKAPGPGSYPSQPYNPPVGQTHSTVVVTQPTMTVVQSFKEGPVRTRCNHCHAEVITGIHYETGTFTWIICFVLWLVGCGFGCCLIPFCVDGCKDVIHTCPNCRQQIARFGRM